MFGVEDIMFGSVSFVEKIVRAGLGQAQGYDRTG